MFEKKAQITIFVIIGIVLLLGALSYFYLSNSQVNKSLDKQFELSSDSDVALIQQQVLVCLDSTLHDASIEAARTNFFYNPSSVLNSGNRPYFYFGGKSFLPEGSVVERKMADFILPKFLLCLDNFSSSRNVLSKQLFFDPSLVSISTDMGLTDLSATVDLGATLSGDSVSKIQPIQSSIDSDLGSLFRAAELTVFSPTPSPSTFFDPAKDFSKNNDLNYVYSFFNVPTSGMLFSVEGSNKDSVYNFPLAISFRLQTGVSK